MASGVNFGTQQYFGFDPRTIPGCALWLDAADTATVVTSGNVVTQWRDKSGLGNTTTAIGGSPTYSSNQINLNGSSTYLAGPYVNTTTTLTAFVVATVNFSLGNYGAYYRLLSVGSTAANDYNNVAYAAAILHEPNSTNIGGYRNGAQNYVSVTTNTPFLLVQQYNGSTAQLYLNGTTSASAGSSGSFSTSSYSIGRDVGNTDGTPPVYAYTYWPGSIREVILFNGSLTQLERQQVEGYLASKWGLLSSLPASHPYKSTPPAMRLFQPVDVPGGALLWLDAADTTTITGSTVTQWRDKSGRASNATTGLGSVVAGTAINGLNTLRFGLNTTLNLSNFVMPTAQTSLFYIIRGITSNANTSQGTGYFIFSRTTDNFLVYTGNQQFFSFQNTPAARSYNAVMGPGGERNWGNLPVPAFFNATSVVSIAGVTYSSSNGLALPQVAASSVSNTVFTASTYQISSSRNIGDVNTYDLGELIVCDGTVGTAIAQQIEGYLAWKWGVRNSLPTTHPYYNVLPSSPLFTPPQLSGLVLWMDPTDSTTLTLSGSSVTQWRDKSATGATFNTVNAAPIYSASLINGLPGIDLTNQSGFISAATQTLTNSLTLAMILVVKSGIDAWGSFFTHGRRNDDIALERNSISTGTTLQFQTANDNAGANITFTTDQVALYLGTMTTGTSRFFSRFGGGTTTTATGTNTSSIVVGSLAVRIGRSDIGENCDSFIGEIVYYNRVLTASERQRVEGYLAWKWGLTDSLPTTHAYKNFRP